MCRCIFKYLVFIVFFLFKVPYALENDIITIHSKMGQSIVLSFFTKN